MNDQLRAVYYTCPFIPAELIAAHGFIPRRVAPPASPQTAEMGNLPGLCPFARAFANFAIGRDDAAAVVVSSACDQMRRLPDLMESACSAPIFTLDLPHTWQEPSAVKLYISELRRLGKFLVGLGAAAPSSEFVKARILEFDQMRARLKAARGTMPAKKWAELAAEIRWSGRCDLNVPESGMGVSPMQNGAATGPSLSPSGAPLEAPQTPAPYVPRGPALAIVGGPLLGDRLELFDLIEEAGAHVALDGTETGELTLPAPINRRLLAEGPLTALAEAYFGLIPAAFRRPNSMLFASLKREIVLRGIKGVILHRFVWCDTWHAEAQRLQEFLPVPVLDLAGADEGYDRERTRTRLGAFVEGLA
jgi:benzoyl-CoA reductase/2-hydroxyglutaryl-CoA dehydratase subunit BcrC/BadD/HgdB